MLLLLLFLMRKAKYHYFRPQDCNSTDRFSLKQTNPCVVRIKLKRERERERKRERDKVKDGERI